MEKIKIRLKYDAGRLPTAASVPGDNKNRLFIPEEKEVVPEEGVKEMVTSSLPPAFKVVEFPVLEVKRIDEKKFGYSEIFKSRRKAYEFEAEAIVEFDPEVAMKGLIPIFFERLEL